MTVCLRKQCNDSLKKYKALQTKDCTKKVWGAKINKNNNLWEIKGNFKTSSAKTMLDVDYVKEEIESGEVIEIIIIINNDNQYDMKEC